MTKPPRSQRYLPLRTVPVLFPGAAQHVALAEWCTADPGPFRARSVTYPGFREDVMWNDPGSAAHRSARAPRCTASGKSIKASTRTPLQREGNGTNVPSKKPHRRSPYPLQGEGVYAASPSSKLAATSESAAEKSL